MIAGDITKLKTSWTKYDAVQVIGIVANGQIEQAVKGEKSINHAILKAFLGINELHDSVPAYWDELKKYPNHTRIFSLLAALFTHHQNISDFARKYSNQNMGGIFRVEDGKRSTNIRSALVEGDASLRKYRRKVEVPFNFSKLFEIGELGSLFKGVLIDRLERTGWNEKSPVDFYSACIEFEFDKALSLTNQQFKKWLNGEGLRSTFIGLEPVNPKFKEYSEITGIKVSQWLNEWNDIDFNSPTRRVPPHHFFLFNIDARLLKRISDVHRRKADKARTKDNSVQRRQSTQRSEEIEKYVHGGFPWSTIKENQQKSPEFQNLKMPGILPTAIIANILGKGSMRSNSAIDDQDLITIREVENSNVVKIKIPDSVFNDDWNPQLLPLEIIDGQHRLLAFDDYEELDGTYELPVVAYDNLDLTWQAYLFYTINIKPVKINTSLGFDLYPLLRTQEWLEKSRETLLVYRETRAQELVEALWLFSESPWRGRINMLGESGGPTMSQAAFIRALTSSFLKTGKERVDAMGGLFGDILDHKNNQVVNWNRAQQAGFLILMWTYIAESVKRSQDEWAIKLRNERFEGRRDENLDFAFTSKNSLLSRDQGVRGISMFANDFFYALANSPDWDLNDFYWDEDLDEKTIEPESISEAIRMFKEDRLSDLLENFANEIVKFDWRTTSADFGGNEDLKNRQALYKGSSGYREIWKGLIRIFIESGKDDLVLFSSQIATKL